jgi:alpha-glucosidase
VYSSISEYEGSLPVSGWPNWIISNHDKSRIASRVGRDAARVAALLLLTLRGTPTIYYGDELGMQDVPVPADRIQDPQGKLLGPQFNRDPQRAPVPWNAERNAGFTTGEPWLSLPRDHVRMHAEVQREDPDSMLHLYRRLLDLRQGEPALRKGDYIPVGVEGDIMAYIRHWEGDRLLVVVNLGRGPGLFSKNRHGIRGEVVLGTERAREGEAVDGAIALGGSEGVIVRLEA